MAHSRIQFDLYQYRDGSIHLFFEDVLGDIGDIDLVVNPDGTVDKPEWDTVNEIEGMERIRNLHTYLSSLLTST